MPPSRTFSDRYRIERELGQGGMATVYLAIDLRHNRPVALKTLREPIASAVGAERFLREIEVTAGLDHPHIVPLLDSGESSGELFYVMPYVEGESLRDRLNRETQLPIETALGIAREVLDALEYAHGRGLVHRDIKPENVLLSGGHARVADFGIARAIAASGDNTLTQTGLALGTPAYMSPEQAAGNRDIDRRSDIYATGCLLYEMLAGQPPFTGATIDSLVHQHIAVEARPVTQLRPTVGLSVAQALSKALAKAPADRFESAARFSEALSAADRAPAIAPTLFGGRRTIGVVAAAVVVLAAIGYIVTRFAGDGATPSRPLVAVLPFRNLGAPEDEYFADGITEEITSRLGRISGIGVISRTTAVRYKGSTRALRDIARELGVQYVLEGTVRTEPVPGGVGRVRVTPELIRGDDDTQLWTDTYTAGLAPGEVFDLQSRIAEQVAGAFHVSLLGPERQAVRRRDTADSAAYRAYLLGRFQLAQLRPSSVREAVDQFETAIARDSLFAKAFAGLSDGYSAMPFFAEGMLPDSEAFARASAAARRSIALDPSAPEAHSALGVVLSQGEWKWDEAEREFLKAIALDPDFATAHARLASVRLALGRPVEALADAQRALALEPTSSRMQRQVGDALAVLGRLDEAVAHYHDAMELEPASLFPHISLVDIAAQRGDLTEMSRELAQMPFRPELARAMAALAADPAQKAAVIRELEAIRSPNPGLDAARKGWLYAAIGERERALGALEQAVDHRSPPGIAVVGMPSVVRALSAEPRYRALLRRIGYPERR